MAEIITADDLPTAIRPHALVGTFVSAANARASRVAPCLVAAIEATDPTDDQTGALDEARLVLIGAVKRWAEAGSGALSQQSAGIFSQTLDTRQRAGFNLWPSEIQGLQAICSSGPVGRQAFAVETAPSRSGAHLPWCSVFLDEPCSCGSNLNRFEGPLYEFGYGLDHI